MANSFCIVASFLVLAATPASSQESVLTLAMAGHSQPTGKIFTVGRNYSPVKTVSLPTTLISEDNGQKVSKPEIKNNFVPAASLEKQSRPGSNDPLLLAHENLGSNRSVSVRAGYEQVWGDGSMLRKISPDEQEPGFACVKASFSF